MGEQIIKKRKEYMTYSMVKNTRAITDSEESETNLDSATDQSNSEVSDNSNEGTFLQDVGT